VLGLILVTGGVALGFGPTRRARRPKVRP
jgi:hypothetical protein